MATVLVVDDEESVRDMVVKMIEPVGYEVIEAGNGAEALDVCKEASVDLIITDIVMPEKMGLILSWRPERNIRIPLLSLFLVVEVLRAGMIISKSPGWLAQKIF